MAADAFDWDLFVSYSHADAVGGKVEALLDAIRQQHERFTPAALRIFFDRESIASMAAWRERILGALRRSKVLLVILSPSYFESPYCREEWQMFVEHERARRVVGGAVTPVYVLTHPGIRAAALGPEAPSLAPTLTTLAMVERRAGNLDAAAAAAERAVAISRRTAVADVLSVTTRSNLALIRQESGDAEGARRAYEEAIEIGHSLGGPSLELALACANLATLESGQGRLEAARRAQAEAAEVRRTVLGERHRAVAAAFAGLADICGKLEDFEAGERALSRAQQALEGLDDPLARGEVLVAEASLAHERADPPRSCRAQRAALDLLGGALGRDHADLARLYADLGLYERSMGNREQARRAYEEALRIGRLRHGPEHSSLAWRTIHLAGIRAELGERAESRRLLLELLAWDAAALPGDDMRRAFALQELAALEEELGLTDLALERMQRCHAIRVARVGSEHPETRAAHDWLAARGHAP